MARKNKCSPEENQYLERSYRNLLFDQKLVSFQVLVKETDLYIKATHPLQQSAHDSVIRHRYQLEQYIFLHPRLLSSLTPLPDDKYAPPMIREMIQTARNAGVGPMAAVAGAMAEAVGKDLLQESPDIVVENGGDVFIYTSREMKVGIFAGKSPLSFHVGLRVPASNHGWGVCTSSGTVGPSISFGHADAVCVVSPSASLADAAATAVGNLVHSPADLSCGLQRAQNIEGLTGVVIIIEDKLGAWGDIELIEI